MYTNFSRPTFTVQFWLLTIGTLIFFTFPALAHKSGGYSHDDTTTANHPRWMTTLPDNTIMSSISMPGTHDTMALYGGDSAQTQSLTLDRQLNAGIRYLDIRCRHINNGFAIHHGMVYQKANFDDVLTTIKTFLTQNPGETVLMFMKEEYTASGNTRTFWQTFAEYKKKYPNLFYVPNGSKNPTLGKVRGKIMMFTPSPEEEIGIDSDVMKSLGGDAYVMTSNFQLYEKWTERKEFLTKALQAPLSDYYMTSLNGNKESFENPNPGSFPYFVASGHSSNGTSAPRLATGKTTPGWKDWEDFPRVNCVGVICTIAFEGLNELMLTRIRAIALSFRTHKKNRIGIVVADFPGPELITAIIAMNTITEANAPKLFPGLPS